MAGIRKNPNPRHAVIRILVIWVVGVVALIIVGFLMRGVNISSIGSAVLAVAVIALLNALLWPILSYIMLPFAVFTLGFVALLMNALIVWLAAQIVPGFEVYDFWTAFWLSLAMTAVNIILSTLLTIDDDRPWLRNQVQSRMKRIAKPEPTEVPGVLFLEIDGLAKPILEKAIGEGHMPNLQRWIEQGSHVLADWETDTSSQTSASQAGILHGNNQGIPAFRWYDKTRGQVVASSNSKLLPLIEAHLSDGNGLLRDQGASRGNLFSGDAVYVMATASAIRDTSKFHTSEFQAFFANPYNAPRTLLLFLWDVILEIHQFRKARKQGIEPILDKSHRGRVYPFIRAAMTVLMRELNIYTLIGDVFAGRPSAYATFVGYDEVAHHSGILDPGAFDILRKLDQQFGRLESVLPYAPRPYYIVVLSDHGQTGGATFKQRYGFSLKDYVQQLMAEKVEVGGGAEISEDWGHLNLFLTDTIKNEDSGASKAVSAALKSRTVEDEVVLGPERQQITRKNGEEDIEEEKHPEVYALASGNLGLVSFTRWPERMTLEEIEEFYPALIPGLVQHEGVGFVMVRSQQHGALVIGAQGTYYLDEDRFEGENPLALFGTNAPDHLRRTDSFPNCPDILVNSFYNPEKNEGCAFEELIGFHGGLGGTQTQPFILHPVELKAEKELIGAASIYRLAKHWLNQLQGVEMAYKEGQDR